MYIIYTINVHYIHYITINVHCIHYITINVHYIHYITIMLFLIYLEDESERSLSNIFSSINVYFHKVSEEERKRFTRYIIAYPNCHIYIYSIVIKWDVLTYMYLSLIVIECMGHTHVHVPHSNSNRVHGTYSCTCTSL